MVLQHYAWSPGCRLPAARGRPVLGQRVPRFVARLEDDGDLRHNATWPAHRFRSACVRRLREFSTGPLVRSPEEAASSSASGRRTLIRRLMRDFQA